MLDVFHTRQLSYNIFSIEILTIASIFFGHQALPLHEPRVWRDDETQSASNISSGGNATFVEMRPFLSAYYYVLVVTQGQVNFDLTLDFFGCELTTFPIFLLLTQVLSIHA